MARHNVELVDQPEVRLISPWADQVLRAIVPYLRDLSEVNRALEAIEDALGELLYLQEPGASRKPEKIDPAQVRDELRRFVRFAERAGDFPPWLSGDALHFLFATAPRRRREISPEGELSPPEVFWPFGGQQLKSWVHAASECMEEELAYHNRTKPGPAFRGDHLAAGVELTDVWDRFTGRGLSRHNRPRDPTDTARDDGPFPTFLAAAIGALDPTMTSGVRLARGIQKVRQRQKQVEQEQAR